MSRTALYLSAFEPSPTAPHAGGRAAHVNLERLQKTHDKVVTVVCSTEVPYVKPHHRLDHRIHQSQKAFAIAQLGRGCWNPGRWLSAANLHTRDNLQCAHILDRAIEAHRPSTLFCDFSQTHRMGLEAAARATHRPTVELCVHDVFAQRLLRSSSLSHLLIQGQVMREEQQWLQAADVVHALSDKDVELLRALYQLPRVELVPFVPPAWVIEVDRSRRQPGRLVFFGNFARPENSQAVHWFLQTWWGWLRQRRPDVELLLVGHHSDRLASELGAFPGVEGTGFCESPATHFSTGDVSIAPLLSGAGVKFKVLEALAAGIPVLATPIGAEGISPQARLRTSPPDAFGPTLLRFLDEQPL